MAIREHRGAVKGVSGGGLLGVPENPSKVGPAILSHQGLEKVHWGLNLGCVAVTTWLPVCEVGTIMVPHPVVDVSIS